MGFFARAAQPEYDRAQHEQRQVLRTYRQAVRACNRAQIHVRSVLQEHGRLGQRRAVAGASTTGASTSGGSSSRRSPGPVAAAVAELRTLRAAAAASATRLLQRLHTLAAAPAYASLVAALATHAGVGAFTAMRLPLEVGDISRFGSAASWTNYLGLTSSEYSTGGGAPHRGPIRKCGPTDLRAALVQCAWASLRSDASLYAVFERVSVRAGRKRAIIAVTSRLALRLRARWLEALAAPPRRPT